MSPLSAGLPARVTREAVLALAGRALEDYRRAMWPALTARGSGAERLRRAFDALCEVAEDGLELLLVLGERIGGALGDPVSNQEDAVRRTFTEPLERLLRDGAADGSLRGTDAAETATVLLNLVGWTYVHLRAEPDWSPRRAKRATLRIALRGVLDLALPRRGAARALDLRGRSGSENPPARPGPSDRRAAADHRAAGAWQSAESRGAWTLVGCTVGPAFEFEGFELAPEGWAPGG